ncbi:unnamed protein product [Phyllotreta striolata]|uniref:Uncharacterized protein n=1 Tax=Phyllotreta striolata TaxID=444603 RepID=A0A9N9U1P0_PHYSR|nr:unnamed protein product [Phyllotreta striolata]
MFKLVVLFAIVAVASAKPSWLAPAVYNTAVVGSVPSTISQHGSSIVHSADLVSPVVHTAPVVHAPIVHAPVVRTIPAVAAYHHAPVVSAYHAAPAVFI